MRKRKIRWWICVITIIVIISLEDFEIIEKTYQILDERILEVSDIVCNLLFPLSSNIFVFSLSFDFDSTRDLIFSNHHRPN